MIIVRYADDLIVGFEHETDARRFLDEMRERLQEFALLSGFIPEKTRLIEFGRFAAASRKRRGLGKPETFTFLSFTFICSKTRRGKFQIKTEVPAGPACRQSCKPSNGNCDGTCISRFPSREDGCGRSSPATLTLPRGAGKQFDTDRVLIPRHQSLAVHATAAGARKTGRPGSGVEAVGGRPAPETRRSFHPVAREVASPLDTRGGSRMPEVDSYGICAGAQRCARVPTAKMPSLQEFGPTR